MLATDCRDVLPAVLPDLREDAVGNGPELCGASLRIGRGRESSRCASGGSMRAQIGTLIIATSAIQLANGFFGTFFSLRVAIENFDATMAGLVLSSYFVGFTLGATHCGRIIERVGHIRAYAAFAGLVAAATAVMPLLVGPLPWLVLRAVVGFGCAGVFVTTESWLNAKAAPIGARTGLCHLHGGHLPGPCGWATPDQLGRYRNRRRRSTPSSPCSRWRWSW